MAGRAVAQIGVVVRLRHGSACRRGQRPQRRPGGGTNVVLHRARKPTKAGRTFDCAVTRCLQVGGEARDLLLEHRVSNIAARRPSGALLLYRARTPQLEPAPSPGAGVSADAHEPGPRSALDTVRHTRSYIEVRRA